MRRFFFACALRRRRGSAALQAGPLVFVLSIVTIGFVSVPAFGLTAHRALPPARIVNGTVTSDYPTVGMLVAGQQLCSATLIGCSTVLTAAHCLCAPNTAGFDSCQREGLPDPNEVVFLPQYALPVQARALAIHPNYVFARGGDLAVVTLAHPVTGIAPAAINRTKQPPIGAAGTIVGFGRSGGDGQMFPQLGLKRAAAVTAAECPPAMNGLPAIPSANHVCVDVLHPSDPGICNGDSGGPLFIDLGDGEVLAGVASGFEADVFDCLPTAFDFHTDVFRYRKFIVDKLGDDSTDVCGDLPAAGGPGTAVHALENRAGGDAGAFHTTVAVPEGADVLRITMNGELVTPAGVNNFDLFVNFGAPADATANRCAVTVPAAFGTCEIDAPDPGRWEITVAPVAGEGLFQLTSTVFGVEPQCAGDCNGDLAVAINELVLGVSEASDGNSGACPAFDLNGDGMVEIDELVAAVNNALAGCPSGSDRSR